MPRPRSSKEIASRIDPDYFKRWGSMRRWRATLSILCAVGALAWWAVAGTRGHNRIYNPGSVVRAHAMWANDCSRCHDNDGKGGFRAAVSDAACLNCHPASAHDPHQLLREGANAHNDLALAVHDPHGGLRSARCAECHVEHRGHAALAAESDSNCTNCHANLNAALQPGSTAATPLSITAFNSGGGHPNFGRNLATKDGKWIDPAVLNFKHATHDVTRVPSLIKGQENCSRCHTASQGAATSMADAALPHAAGYTEAGRYMLPANYQRTCAECHQLSLPLGDRKGASLPHESLAVLRDQFADLPGLFHRSLGSLSVSQRQDLLGADSEEAWMKSRREALHNDLLEWLGGPGEKLVDPKLKEAFEGSDESAWPDAHLVEAYVAYRQTRNGCAECHTVSVDANRAGSQPALSPLATVPTKIPQSTPRRWFLDSRFDHAAHQNMTCASCHAGAPSSQSLSEAMLPNDTWNAQGKTVSCADCHHKPNSAGPGASANCVACHAYHTGRS